MVDTCVSGAYEEIRGGSSPPFGILRTFIYIMKVLLRIFCILVMIFVPSFCQANDGENIALDTISSVPAFVYVADNETENSISSSNFYNAEILSLGGQKQTYSSSDLFKTSVQNKLLAQIFAQNYNKVFLSKSHKISYFLRNEICTRAP